MKFTMNGALTIGTLDGANVEIREAVGEENFFLFGRTVEEVQALWAAGYRPLDFYERDTDLRRAIDLIASGHFSPDNRDLFRPLTGNLLDSDPFMVCADFRDYVDCQARVSELCQHSRHWSRMSILNVARCGRFSSDRAVREYSEDIWRVSPLPLDTSTT
jgi:starch phosphorylase